MNLNFAYFNLLIGIFLQLKEMEVFIRSEKDALVVDI